MVHIVGDDLLKDLNDGKVIELEIGGLCFSLANEKWGLNNGGYSIGDKVKIIDKNANYLAYVKFFEDYKEDIPFDALIRYKYRTDVSNRDLSDVWEILFVKDNFAVISNIENMDVRLFHIKGLTLA